MPWSKYQNAIFNYALNPENGSFVVKAVAGSGKTTTAVECAKRMSAANPDARILFLAFNKSIVEKLKQETAEFPNMTCKTLHGFGMSTLMRSSLKFHVNDHKWRDYIKKNLHKYLKEDIGNESREYQYIMNCTNLLNMCRINLVKTYKNKDEVEKYAKLYNIRIIANEINTVSKLMKKTTQLIPFKTENGYEIDFADMLCLPLTDSFRKFISKYDIVFIDEAQDLNKAQQMLMLDAVKKTGKFIAVGDPNQAINGFAGAMRDSFTQLQNIAGKMLPLSVNYRCGKKIIENAQTLVPEIEPYEDAIAGEVIETDNLKDVAQGDMIICRKTAPLVLIALRLMSIGKSAFIKGKDIAEDMKRLIDTVVGKQKNITTDNLMFKLNNYLEEAVLFLVKSKVQYPTSHPMYTSLKDKIDCIKILGEHCYSVSDIMVLLDKIFADTENGDAIMCSTIHKAKGLESDNVYIICPDLLPMIFKNQQPWELEQENNLKYVAFTRAKKKLVIVDGKENELNEIEL